MTNTTDGRHTENRWLEQFMIGEKIHGLLRTHTAVSKQALCSNGYQWLQYTLFLYQFQHKGN